MKKKVDDRFGLFTLLSEACELEHGLACSYLYAGFSLKQDLTEGGLSWEQLQLVRRWAGAIYHVAAEEMLHLAQAWNLLTAIGGTPWYGRPGFPIPSSYYPLNLPLEARPFSLETLERFIAFEKPQEVQFESRRGTPDGPPEFGSVGELYGLISQGLGNIPDLFIGNPAHQVGPELVDFPDLIKVTDVESADKAVKKIVEQGEGTDGSRENSHYEVFLSIRRTYLAELASSAAKGIPFEPVRPCVSNPVAHPHPSLGMANALPILDPFTAQVADAFDSIYGLMLRLLQLVFDGATSNAQGQLRPFALMSLNLMTTVIKPLGEALACLPAGPPYKGATAGPCFSIGRHIPLPLDTDAATVLVREKIEQLQGRLNFLSKHHSAPEQLLNASARMQQIKI